MPWITLQQCAQFDVQRELLRNVNEGSWNGLSWQAHLADEENFLLMGGSRWSLVSSDGRHWSILGRDGQRVTSLYLTPARRLGTRGELGLDPMTLNAERAVRG
jgi:hypothetical protein